MVGCVACIVIGGDGKWKKPEQNYFLPQLPSQNADTSECIKVLQAQQNLHTFWSTVTTTANWYAFEKEKYNYGNLTCPLWSPFLKV